MTETKTETSMCMVCLKYHPTRHQPRVEKTTTRLDDLHMKTEYNCPKKHSRIWHKELR